MQKLTLSVVAKGIVQPKFYKRWPQLCRVLRRSLLTTIFDEFSGISVVIKFGIFHEWHEHATFQILQGINANFEPVFEPAPELRGLFELCKIRIPVWGSNEVRLRFARELIFPISSLLDVFFWSAWSLFVSISWQFRWAHDRSAKALSNGAASAQEALGNCFPVRISYKFLISDCRGDSDLGLRSSWHLAQRIPQRSGRICFIQGVCHNFEPIRALHGSILCARCQELHRCQARSPLQIDIMNLYYIRTEK